MSYENINSCNIVIAQSFKKIATKNDLGFFDCLICIKEMRSFLNIYLFLISILLNALYNFIIS